MSQRDRLLDHIRRIALQGIGERRTDGQLLEHFISARDEAAFALLLRRHGAMVWSVCRRVLGNAHDADDAFQAAFLVLVRKADSIRPREAVGNWLYGVAYRTSLEARKRLARRQAKERSLQDVPPPESKKEEACPELGPILDRELSRLSDKYRLPIVLCDLEGRSRKDVAVQLAIPEGTLSSRLATARKKLAARLARYDFAVCAASLGTLLTEKTASANLSFSLLSATTKAALSAAAGSAAVAGIISATVNSLTEGVLKTMLMAKIKSATLIVCSVAALGVGTGGVYYQARIRAADAPGEIQSDQNPPEKASRSSERNRDDWRRIAEELRSQLEADREKARLRVQELHMSAAKLRHETDELRAEIKAMRQEKTARQQQLGLQLEEGKLLEDYGPAHPRVVSLRAQMELARQQRSQSSPAPNSALEKIEISRDQLKKEYAKGAESVQAQLTKVQAEEEALQRQRRQVEEQIKAVQDQRGKLTHELMFLKRSFDDQVQKLADMEYRIKNEQGVNPSKEPPPMQKPASGDKLDQILQRLERLEKRLDRLEKNRQ